MDMPPRWHYFGELGLGGFPYCRCPCCRAIRHEDATYTNNAHKRMKCITQYANLLIYNRNTTVSSLHCVRTSHRPSFPKKMQQEEIVSEGCLVSTELEYIILFTWYAANATSPSKPAAPYIQLTPPFFPEGHPYEDYQTLPFGFWFCLSRCFPCTWKTFVS